MTDIRSASYWQRSEDPRHPDNGPSVGDLIDMDLVCPECGDACDKGPVDCCDADRWTCQTASNEFVTTCRRELECEYRCGEHDGTGVPCPTCDLCNRSECRTRYLEWNGETGNHVACEKGWL